MTNQITKSETVLLQSYGLSASTISSMLRENPCEITTILPKKILKFTVKNRERKVFAFFTKLGSFFMQENESGYFLVSKEADKVLFISTIYTLSR